MKVYFHKSFNKMARKLPPKVHAKAKDRIILFSTEPLNPILRVHALQTPYKGSYGIDITGDYRAIYQLIDDQTALFTHIGTHSQLYR
jgi:addiction module RelE/StbE family toxin